jgi:hypothetical protein
MANLFISESRDILFCIVDTFLQSELSPNSYPMYPLYKLGYRFIEETENQACGLFL